MLKELKRTAATAEITKENTLPLLRELKRTAATAERTKENGCHC
jgi:hypothetical protein